MERASLWRLATIVLVVVLAVVVIVALLDYHGSSTSSTVVQWHTYEVSVERSENSTSILGYTLCPNARAVSSGLISMTWDTTPTVTVSQFHIFYLLPPAPGHPLGVPVVLYDATNSSSGGTAFRSGTLAAPTPCGYTWILGVTSSTPTTLTASFTLLYNETTS
jgi:hypothetical protein